MDPYDQDAQQGFFGQPAQPRRRGLRLGRLAIAAIIVIVSLVSYYGKRSVNPVTNEVQYVSMSVKQEVGLGLQAAPELAQQHGGLHPDERLQAHVTRVGERITAVPDLAKSEYPFRFRLLADEKTVDAFALPGGPVFITAALLRRLETDGQLAGVLAHEIGHVVARHGAEHLAKAELTQGITGAVAVAAYDPDNPRSTSAGMMAAMVGKVINLRYGRNDELESDRLGLRFAADAGYDPRSMVRVMEILRDAGGDQPHPPEFMSTHPDPEQRIKMIEQTLRETFPKGVPAGLEP